MVSPGEFWGPYSAKGYVTGARLKASTHRLQSSSFLGLPYRILNINHKKELLWSTF